MSLGYHPAFAVRASALILHWTIIKRITINLSLSNLLECSLVVSEKENTDSTMVHMCFFRQGIDDDDAFSRFIIYKCTK